VLVKVNEGENTQMLHSETQAKVEQYTDCLSQNDVLKIDILDVSNENKPQRVLIAHCVR
jgi:hypothetical protein